MAHGLLHLTILSAKDLPKRVRLGEQRCYVQVVLGSSLPVRSKTATSATGGGQSTAWHETLFLQLTGEQQVVLQVFAVRQLVKDVELGTAVLSFDTVQQTGSDEVTLQLTCKDGPAGALSVKLLLKGASALAAPAGAQVRLGAGSSLGPAGGQSNGSRSVVVAFSQPGGGFAAGQGYGSFPCTSTIGQSSLLLQQQQQQQKQQPDLLQLRQQLLQQSLLLGQGPRQQPSAPPPPPPRTTTSAAVALRSTRIELALQGARLTAADLMPGAQRVAAAAADGFPATPDLLSLLATASDESSYLTEAGTSSSGASRGAARQGGFAVDAARLQALMDVVFGPAAATAGAASRPAAPSAAAAAAAAAAGREQLPLQQPRQLQQQQQQPDLPAWDPFGAAAAQATTAAVIMQAVAPTQQQQQQQQQQSGQSVCDPFAGAAAQAAAAAAVGSGSQQEQQQQQHLHEQQQWQQQQQLDQSAWDPFGAAAFQASAAAAAAAAAAGVLLPQNPAI